MQIPLNSELSAVADHSGPGRIEHGRAGDVVSPHNGGWMDVKSDWRISNGRFSYRVRDAIEGASQASGRRQAFGVAR